MFFPNSLRVDFIEQSFMLNGKISDRQKNIYMWRVLCARMERPS